MDEMKAFWLGSVASLLCAGCSVYSSTAAQPGKRSAPTDVVATVGSTSITLGEVDEKALQQPVASFGGMKLMQALYEARRATIDDIVAATLLDQEAKARGIDRSTLVENEITSQVSPATDADVAAWYQENQARVRSSSLDQVRPAIRAYLLQERTEEMRRRFIDTLKSKTVVRVVIESPRQQMDEVNAPAKGPGNAPIELIEFSDFECPFCRRAQPTVAEVLSTYGDRVRLVYRHFPLPGHANARPAAEASACAADQDRFWPYHDRLFADASRLGGPELKQAAADLGLDTETFNACVESHKHKAQVDADVKAGAEAGVDGTPAFFVNGRLITGAQPFAVFKRIIDEELQLKLNR